MAFNNNYKRGRMVHYPNIPKVNNTPGFDLDIRDPNDINRHLQVQWDDIIAEPEGIKSLNFIWKCSYYCFSRVQTFLYQVLTFLTAPCLAFCMGCNFACLTYFHVWCFSPCIRVCKINMAAFRKCIEICCAAICAPCCETCGLCCSRIRIRYQRAPDGWDDRPLFLI